MEFEDDAFVLSARAHGETGAVVDLLTATRGRWAAYVAGASSRRLRPWLQAGARVEVRYRARLSDQLGGASLDGVGEGPSALFDDPLALAGLASAAAVCAAALPEREPHPSVYAAFGALCAALAGIDAWPAVYVRFEAGLLEDLGFGLDLAKCAVTGLADDLRWVSPRTGRAVSAEAGAAYADRLLRLPGFLLSAQRAPEPGDIRDGLRLTGHFLEAFVFSALNRPVPPQRVWLADRLEAAGRL